MFPPSVSSACGYTPLNQTAHQDDWQASGHEPDGEDVSDKLTNFMPSGETFHIRALGDDYFSFCSLFRLRHSEVRQQFLGWLSPTSPRCMWVFTWWWRYHGEPHSEKDLGSHPVSCPVCVESACSPRVLHHHIVSLINVPAGATTDCRP